MKDKFAKIREYCPVYTFVSAGAALLCLVLHALFYASRDFADFFNLKISSGVRIFLSYVTKYLPFSVAEFLIMAMPFALVALIVYVVKVSSKETKKTVRLLFVLLSVLMTLYVLFVLCFASAYRGSTIDEKLGLDRTEVSSGELYETAKILLEETEKAAEHIEFNYGSFSVMPYSLDEMNEKLMDAYKAASKKYDFLPVFDSHLKYIVLSEPMTYTHISGVYSYFTGEANINTNFPDYTIPYTAAHELAHQRGIAREDEANFVAFLVCIESDDPYVRYSAYSNVLEYVLSALYRADSKKYYEIMYSADAKIRCEFAAYSSFFDKYRDNVIADVSDAMNNGYLVSQGQSAGSQSYGLVVDLAVAYYQK